MYSDKPHTHVVIRMLIKKAFLKYCLSYKSPLTVPTNFKEA